MQLLWTERNFCQKPEIKTILVLFSFFTKIINLALKFACIIFAAEGFLLDGVSDVLSAPTFDNDWATKFSHRCSLSSFNPESVLRNAMHNYEKWYPALIAEGGVWVREQMQQ